MGETKWTEEQLAAITTRKCNLLIAAAAGSGKTAVLVERIIKIITNEEAPVDIDKLLVVTFTNAAAAEMRERIAGAITKELEAKPNSKNLQKQLTLLSRSNITTMHSFCLDVIKNNFHTIDLDPGFRILDETEGVLLKGEIINDLFEDMYESSDEEFLRLVEAYSGSRDDEKLKEIVLNLYRFSMSGPWPEKWLNDKSEEFNINSIQDLNESQWVKILKDNMQIEFSGLISMLTKSIDLIRVTDGLEPYMDNFTEDLSNLERLYETLNEGIEVIFDALNSISFSKLKTVRKNNVSDLEAQDTVKGIRDDIKKKIGKLKEDVFAMTPEEMVVSTKKCYPYMKKLSQIVIEFDKRFSAKKKERSMLDFNDLEHFCLKILINRDEDGQINPSKIATGFREFFDEVLVDEYQDSNNVQETIINLVSRKNSDNPNVFMVGDVKQSIYRFRQAKPELFLEKYNTYSKTESKSMKIQLYKNFRSRQEVIDGVNYIFKTLMSKVVGELEYTDEEALNLGANYESLEDSDAITGGEIELHILDKSGESISEEINIDDEDEEDIAAVNLEARIVAKRINEFIEQKNEKNFKVLDKATGKYRPVTYKDIVILLRATKNWSEVFLDELGMAGIPAYADTGSGYFESIEIRTIMALLKVIDNPMQDVAIIALLRSPIMSFTVEELADIRIRDKSKYFYENILDIANDEEANNNELKEKCKGLVERLTNWRDRAVFTPIDEFIWFLYMDTAYYGYIGAMPNGVLRQANLRILFQRAKQYEQTSFKGLFNFINFINKLRKSSGDMGSAKILGENEDVVRIMSIHKSKGLEFPVVFLCGSGKQFNLMDLNNSILYHEELGFGPDFVDLEKRISYTTLPKEAIKKRIRLETLSEEMRILYVAFTRAKEKLIITGATRDVEKSIKKWVNAATLDSEMILESEVLKGKSYLDWIGMALCKHKDGEALREVLGCTGISLKGDTSIWSTKIWSKSDLIVEKGETESLENEEDILVEFKPEKVDKEIERRLGFKYKYKDATSLRSNFTVSDLKKKTIEEEDMVDTIELYKPEKIEIKPRFLQEKTGLTSAEKGTAMHYVMQKIDLNKVDTLNDIKDQIKYMLDAALLSEEEYKIIRPFKIYNFFRSDLGKRMLSSYKNGEQIYRELPFYTEVSCLETDQELPKELKDEMVRVQGVIDAFFYEEDDIILLDYKTDYVEEGNEEEVISRYNIQMKYYSEAIEKITGKRVTECYLYLFSIEKEFVIDLNQ